MKEYNKTKSEENKCLFQDENSENKINPQAEDGIRDGRVTGVQTCALPILSFEPQHQQEDMSIPDSPM